MWPFRKKTNQSVLNNSGVPCDVFGRVREGCRFVADHAQHVTINDWVLRDYAQTLSPRAPNNVLDLDHHYDSNDLESLAAYIMALEAINFGSGYEAALVEEGWRLRDHSIYYTVSTALKYHFDSQGPMDAATMAGLSVLDCHRMFGLPHRTVGTEVAVLFAAALNELGTFVQNHFDGSFLKLVQDADGHAARLVCRLVELPGFQDVHNYHGRAIPLYKRAQIAAADLHLAFVRHGRPLFGDMDRLTLFADNAVPHVLVTDGVLTLSDALAARIAAGEFIPAGSDEEIELRACAVEAVERICAIKGVRVMDIDHVLWHRSVEDPRYMATPPHRTRTRFY